MGRVQNDMRKLILFFLLLSGVAYGQSNNTTNTKFTNGVAVPNGVSQKPTSGLTAGALSYVTGAGLYVYNGSAWELLGLSSGGVTSFNARTGVVVPLIGDYSSFYVPLTRSLTINGATQTLAADRTWTITANTPNSLSTGYGLTGGVFDGSVAWTYAADTLSVGGLVSKLRLATNLTGYVKKATTITINGVTQDLSDNRIWTAGTVTSITPGYGLTPQTAITSTGGFAVDTLVLDTVYAKIGAAPTISFGTFGSTPNAQGGSYSGGVITLQPASASFPGGVTTGTQTWAGDKTFTGTVTADSLSGALNYSNITGGTASQLVVANGAAVSYLTMNTPASVVLRDASGDFSAGTITATGGVFNGNVRLGTSSRLLLYTTATTGTSAGDIALDNAVRAAGVIRFRNFADNGYLTGMYADGSDNIQVGAVGSGNVKLHNLSMTGDISAANLESGTYTPTLTNTLNVSSSSANLSIYSRVGNTVTVSGFVDITPTGSGLGTVKLSLPITSNFTLGTDAIGSVSCGNTVLNSVYILADGTSDTANLSFNAASSSSTNAFYSFQYLVK